MKEVIFSNFGLVGALLLIVLVILFKYNPNPKYLDFVTTIVIICSIYGAMSMFDNLGKWILK